MVNRKKRLIWVGVCLLLLFSVFKCQISESVWERSNAEILAKKQNYKAEISKEELDDFIRLWPQFKELGLADDLIVSYEVDRPSKFIDWKSKIWFVYHKWDADRFFMCNNGQRLCYIFLVCVATPKHWSHNYKTAKMRLLSRCWQFKNSVAELVKKICRNCLWWPKKKMF